MMKLLKITAAVLVILIPLSLASDARAGLWTDIKAKVIHYYHRFRKDTKTAAKEAEKDSREAGREAAADARKAGAQIRDSSKELGRSFREGLESAKKDFQSAFQKAKEKAE